MFHNILKKEKERAIQASCFSVFNENLNMCVLPLGKQVNPSQLLAQQTLLILVLILTMFESACDKTDAHTREHEQ